MTVKDRDSERVGPMLNPPHLRELLRESMEENGWNVTDVFRRQETTHPWSVDVPVFGCIL